jgi:hypothetical protein
MNALCRVGVERETVHYRSSVTGSAVFAGNVHYNVLNPSQSVNRDFSITWAPVNGPLMDVVHRNIVAPGTVTVSKEESELIAGLGPWQIENVVPSDQYDPDSLKTAVSWQVSTLNRFFVLRVKK